MIRQVRETIARYDMLPPGTRVLCGLSGGADSVSLVLCLYELRQELGIQLCACHFNHGLRGEQADADEAFCRALCARYDIPFAAEKQDVAAFARRRKQSVETAARALRYDFFARSAKKFQAQRIATAHTADDNLETMLFHLIRGTGAAGLAGIPPVRGSIVRPLIAVERVQLEAYLRGRGQTWCIDATNLDDSCTRNRIRHHVIPALRDIEPTAARHAAHTAALLRQERDCIEQLAQVNGTAVDVTLLCSQPPAVAMQQLRQLLHNAGVPMGEIGRRHLDALRGLAEKPTGQISLPGRYCAVRAGDRLEITRQKKQKETILPIRLEQSVQLGAYTVQITRKISDIYSSFKQYPIAYDTINNAIKNSGVESLQIRTWRPTDRMTPFGARGARTLKRLYTERGILPAQRDTLPVICCGEDIVAAIGIGVDQKYSGSTGMLLFSLTGEDSTK